MRIFEIGEQFQALYEMAEQIETDEDGNTIDNSDTLAELFDELGSNLEGKLENTNYIIKELAGVEQMLKDEARRLTEKAKVMGNRQARLKDLIKNAIESSGQDKIKTDKFSFTVKTLESYNYEDVSLFGLDSKFVRVKEEIDKTKLKEFIKAGGFIDGIKIDTKTSLTIR